MNQTNPTGMKGIAFVELASPQPERLERLFQAFGFSRTLAHRTRDVDVWTQNAIRLHLAREPRSHADAFREAHGPSISALGFLVHDAQRAFGEAVRRGACPATDVRTSIDAPAVYGIGNSLIYFVDEPLRGFAPHPEPVVVPAKGFTCIDHLTNNVHAGTLRTWADFYVNTFGFTEVRSFDITGARTGLYSFALRSPCGTFCIPINEGKETASQIEEYLREHRGPGVQHLAFLTDDILASIDALDGQVPMLDIDADYYATVFERVPHVREDHAAIRARSVLVDGDDAGYLLQIFTRNLIGPIFIELIQRRNHFSFGEGNFGALFRSLERDQERRGIFDALGRSL